MSSNNDSQFIDFDFYLKKEDKISEMIADFDDLKNL